MNDVFEKIEWIAPLSVGVEEIDNDHKSIIRQYNILIEKLALSYDPAVVLCALEFLNHYIETHFAREEALMKRIGYPDLAQHGQSHDYLKHQVHYLFKRFIDDKSLAVAEAIAALTGEWLTHHIMKEDRAIGDFIRSQNSLKAEAVVQTETEVSLNSV